MNQLGGKIAVVTGGGRGIGQGIVLALAEAGADIVIADINLTNAEATAREVEMRDRQRRKGGRPVSRGQGRTDFAPRVGGLAQGPGHHGGNAGIEAPGQHEPPGHCHH